MMLIWRVAKGSYDKHWSITVRVIGGISGIEAEVKANGERLVYPLGSYATRANRGYWESLGFTVKEL